MKLFFKDLGGEGRPIIILHGLFGSSKNWISNGKNLVSKGRVLLLDQRNHGDSPHSEEHKLEDMVEDLREFILENNLKEPIIIGHSMGGLVASLFALNYPEIPHAIFVVDIAPRSYDLNYDSEFSALNMDVSKFNSRQEIDSEMAKILPDPFIRQFLQMNLERLDNGYRWKLNVKGIQNSRKALNLNLDKTKKFNGNTMFVIGGISEYVEESDFNIIKNHFPNVKIEIIEDGNHYLHYTKAEQFLAIVSDFLEKVN